VQTNEEWHVTCRTKAGRRRGMSVFVDQGNVVIVLPSGETAVLAPLEVGRLREALRAAVVAAAFSGRR
jgi:hypothetical protein